LHSTQPEALKAVEFAQGEVGVLLGVDDDQYRTQWSSDVVKVMFHDGIHVCHMSNLQKPDGRLKPRR